MSEMVKYKGKATLVEKLENETLEEQCKRLLENVELESYYDSYMEQIGYEDNNYVILSDNIYLLDKKECDFNDDYCHINKIDDKTFEFDTAFYNGGTSLCEMLEEEFNKYNKKTSFRNI